MTKTMTKPRTMKVVDDVQWDELPVDEEFGSVASPRTLNMLSQAGISDMGSLWEYAGYHKDDAELWKAIEIYIAQHPDLVGPPNPHPSFLSVTSVPTKLHVLKADAFQDIVAQRAVVQEMQIIHSNCKEECKAAKEALDKATETLLGMISDRNQEINNPQQTLGF